MPSPHRAITGGSGKIRYCRCLTINETRCLVWCRVQGKGRVGLSRDDGEVGLPRFCFCVCFCFCAPFRVRLVCPILIRLYLLLDFPHYTHATIHNTSAARAPTLWFFGVGYHRRCPYARGPSDPASHPPQACFPISILLTLPGRPRHRAGARARVAIDRVNRDKEAGPHMSGRRVRARGASTILNPRIAVFVV